MPHLAHILIYPIKSLPGVRLEQAEFLESGALKGDREFAIVDSQGKYVNGKRTEAIHRIDAAFDRELRKVTLQIRGTEDPTTFHLDSDRPALDAWFSDYFGFSARLIQNTAVGFPDDEASPGPTVISTETLQTVATWFPGLELEETRDRFRTNLEFQGGGAFWEDRLFSADDRPVAFQIGEVRLHGINPCQRCIVPTRNSETGEGYPQFQKVFQTQRRETLPVEVAASRFNHFYRLAVNTRVPGLEAGKRVQVGDSVQLTASP